MKRRLFNLAAAVSLAFCLSIAGLWVRSCRWTDTFYIQRNPSQGRAVTSCFGWLTLSHSQISPGSGFQLHNGPRLESWRGRPPNDIPLPWHGSFGVRYFRLTMTAMSLNAVRVSYGWLLALFSVLPIAWVYRAQRRRQRLGRNICLHCGYDLRHTRGERSLA